MISTDRLYTAAYAARLSWRDFAAIYPPRIYLSTTLPRSILQATFFALVGYWAGGENGREFAFVGACCQIIVLATVVRGPDVLIDDRIMGTLHRLRLGNMPLPALAAARWWVYVGAGFVDALVCVVVVGAVVGELDLAPQLLAAAPLFLLLAVTTASVGLLVAAISLTHRVDFLLANLAAYLMLVFCGVVAPISAFGDVGETLVRLLPLTNGLLAIRDVIGGDPWLTNAALELAAGVGWAALAVGVLQIQARRARSRGADELL